MFFEEKTRLASFKKQATQVVKQQVSRFLKKNTTCFCQEVSRTKRDATSPLFLKKCVACSFQEGSLAKREATKTDVLSEEARLASGEKQVVRVAEQKSHGFERTLGQSLCHVGQPGSGTFHSRKITITAGHKNPYDAATPY